MDVAVTGSSGFIGTALCASLQADGHRVIKVVRRPVRDGELAIQWDPTAGTIDAKGLEGLDAVVHLAGAGIGDKRWNDQRKREILESRTRGTALLTETLAGLDAKPPVLLSGSAMGYYGERGDEVCTEETPAGDIFLSEVCVAWEAAAQPAVDAGIRVPFLRTGIVLDPAGGVLKRLLLLFKPALGGKLGSGRQWWSWISLHDQIAAMRWLIENDVAGPVNLTAPEPVTNADFTKALGAALHRPTFLTVPAFGPKLLLGSEMAQQLLFISERVLPTVLEREGFTFTHRTLGAALDAIL
jgi:uncharacterized protein (TIGR01777 family)